MLAGLVLMTTSATPAWACSYVSVPVKQSTAASTVVLRGVVEWKQPTKDGQQRYIVRVTHVWKGDVADSIEVVDTQASSTCAMALNVFTDEIFMLQREGDRFTMQLGTGSRPHDDSSAAEVNAELGAGRAVSSVPMVGVVSHGRTPWILGGVGAVVIAFVVWRILRRRA
ncbi:hypothetical protein AESSP_02001 [Aestuariimicrobium sp. T2.26MG-19.2B]|nr:hypothetical protein AESSP_02001 [Aestuariimicrobium sp. T2.26MG-19.2B]